MERPTYKRFIIFVENEEWVDKLREDVLMGYFYDFHIMYSKKYANDVFCIKTDLSLKELCDMIKCKKVVLELTPIIKDGLDLVDQDMQKNYLKFLKETDPVEINQESVDKILDKISWWGHSFALTEEEKYVLHEFSKQTV